MRIAMLSWESLHSIAVGGGAAHVTELSAAMVRRGHDVHVFTRGDEGQDGYSFIDGVHYHRCPFDLHPDFVTEVGNMCHSFVASVAAAEAHQNRLFDVVHGHDWLCAKGIVETKNDCGRPTVFTVHSTQFGRDGNHHAHGNCERVREIEHEGTYVADRVITVSGVLADEVKWQYQVPDWKLRVAYNGIDCRRFDHPVDCAACRQRYGIGPRDPMVLFVGRMTTQKGPDILLDAVPGILERHPDAKVVFVGDGDMRGELEWRAHQKGVWPAVRFTGAMAPNGEVTELYKSCDVVCVPSRNEPFGIVVLEAWAAGKPVIATLNGGPRDFVSHGEDGLLIHDDAFAVCTAVWDLFGDFGQVRRMGENGRAKAVNEFGWDAVATQTELVYQEIAGGDGHDKWRDYGLGWEHEPVACGVAGLA